ncbi:hypothetical protein Tco_1223068, partial [Tanacetum coccineum]
MPKLFVVLIIQEDPETDEVNAYMTLQPILAFTMVNFDLRMLRGFDDSGEGDLRWLVEQASMDGGVQVLHCPPKVLNSEGKKSPYVIIEVTDLAQPATENAPAVPAHKVPETYKNISLENRAYFDAKAE